jgi:molybdenum cofactor cytidylyltransferase
METVVHGILLAAGESRRMGFPKPLLTIGSETWLAHLVATLLAAVPRLTIVLGAHAERVRAAVPVDQRIAVVENPDFTRGQLSSLKVGLAAVPSAAGAVMVHLVDHPMVSAATFAGVVAVYQQARQPIVIARYGGRRGHPVIFDRSIFAELLAAPEALGARAVVQADPARVAYFDGAESGIIADLDTPADVVQAGLIAPSQER